MVIHELKYLQINTYLLIYQRIFRHVDCKLK